MALSENSASNTEQNTKMSYKWHPINDPLDIPFEYGYVRRLIEVYDPLDPPNPESLFPDEAKALNDFMTGGRTDDIDPFWAQDQFMTNCTMQVREDKHFEKTPISDEMYERMKPALRLATVMVQRNVDLWLTILHAPVRFDSRIPQQHPWRPYFDEEAFTVKDSDRINFKSSILPQMKAMTVIGLDETIDSLTFGTATAIWAATPESEARLLIGLACNKEVYGPCTTSEDFWKGLTHEEKCRAWVHLAITLVHEFAHGLHLFRERESLTERAESGRRLPGRIEEYKVLSIFDEAEMGWTFEINTFGAILDMRLKEYAWPDCSQPTIFDYSKMLDVPRILTQGTPGSAERDVADIAPETMVRFMQESTWADDKPLDIYMWQHK